jgi:hypothetical protein
MTVGIQSWAGSDLSECIRQAGALAVSQSWDSAGLVPQVVTLKYRVKDYDRHIKRAVGSNLWTTQRLTFSAFPDPPYKISLVVGSHSAQSTQSA